jgi:hypothetical protein
MVVICDMAGHCGHWARKVVELMKHFHCVASYLGLVVMRGKELVICDGELAMTFDVGLVVICDLARD